MDRPKCPFCTGDMSATEPVVRDPAFRCIKCNVRIVVTNQSYLPLWLKRLYWHWVNTKTLMKQVWG